MRERQGAGEDLEVNGSDKTRLARRIALTRKQMKEKDVERERKRFARPFKEQYTSSIKIMRKEKVNEQVDRIILQNSLNEDSYIGRLMEKNGSGSDDAAVKALLGDLQLRRDKEDGMGNESSGTSRFRRTTFSTNPLDSKDATLVNVPVSEMFLKRALVRSSGGAMLALNDGYHLRSYLNSQGVIQLTPRVKTRKSFEGGSTAAAASPGSQGDVPPLPAERSPGGADTRHTTPGVGGGAASGGGIVDAVPALRLGSERVPEQTSTSPKSPQSPNSDPPRLISTPAAQPLSQLCDCLFLVGPNKEDVELAIAKHAASFDGVSESGAGATTSGRERASSIRGRNASVKGQLKDVMAPVSKQLEPCMLYSTARNPDLDADLLPFFCFPGGVCVGLRLTPSVEGLSPKALHSPGLSGSMRRKSVGGTSNKASSANKGSTRCFSFLLTNHTSSQYGACFVFPKAFRDPKTGLSVTVEYCVCAVTRLPFLTFLFNCFSQFEAIGGFDVSINPGVGVASSSPVSSPLISSGHLGPPLGQLPTVETMYRVQDESMPLQGSLWALNDLATRLSRLKVPLYPATTPESGVEKEGTGGVGHGDPLLSRTVAFAPLSLAITVRGKRLEMTFDRDGVWRHFADYMKPLEALAVEDGEEEEEGFGGGDMLDTSLSPTGVDRQLSDANKHFAGVLAERELEVSQHVLVWALPLLLRHLPLDQILLALGCALSEMKIVLISEDSTVLSGCLLALWHLLRPFKWAGNVVVTLPDFLSELLESPSFFLLGMQALPPDFVLPQGLVVIEPVDRIVHLHPADVVTSHTIMLPRSKRLLGILKPYAEQILSASRNSRKEARAAAREAEKERDGPHSSFIASPGSSSVATAETMLTHGRSPYSEKDREGWHGGSGGTKNAPSTPESKGPFSPIGTGFTPEGGGVASVIGSGGGYGNVSTTPMPPPVTSSPRMSLEMRLAKSGAPASCAYLPSELDSRSNTGRQLHAAVAHFSHALSSHLQLLANSAVVQEKKAREVVGEVKGKEDGAEERAAKDDTSSTGLSRALNPFTRKEKRAKGEDGKGAPPSPVSGAGAAVASIAPDLPSEFGDTVPGEMLAADSARATAEGGISGHYASSGGDNDRLSGDANESEETNRNRKSVSAMVLGPEDIGDSGLVFLRRLARTQAFSNYCFEKTSRGESRRMAEVRGQYKQQLARHEEQLEIGRESEGGTSPDLRIMLDTTPQGLRDLSDEGLREITLKSLFTVALTGSLPVESTKVQDMQTSLERLDADIERQYTEKCMRDLSLDLAMIGGGRRGSMSLSGAGMGGEQASLVTVPPPQADPTSGAADKDGNILWCNGRCSGLADTPSCTSICIMLWAKRVKQAKSKQRVRGIIHRSVSGTSKGNPHLHPRESVLRSVQLSSGEVVDLLPRGQPQRHPRETKAQYQLRVGESNIRGHTHEEASLDARAKSLTGISGNQEQAYSSYSRTSQLISQSYGGAKAKRGEEREDRARLVLMKFIKERCRKPDAATGEERSARAHNRTRADGHAAGQIKGGPHLTAIEAMAVYHLRRGRQAHRIKSQRAISVLKPFVMRLRARISARKLSKVLSCIRIRTWLRRITPVAWLQCLERLRQRRHEKRAWRQREAMDRNLGVDLWKEGEEEEEEEDEEGGGGDSSSDGELEEPEREAVKEEGVTLDSWEKKAKQQQRQQASMLHQVDAVWSVPTHKSKAQEHSDASGDLAGADDSTQQQYNDPDEEHSYPLYPQSPDEVASAGASSNTGEEREGSKERQGLSRAASLDSAPPRAEGKGGSDKLDDPLPPSSGGQKAPSSGGQKASLRIDIEDDDSMELSRSSTPTYNPRSPDKTVPDAGSGGPSPRVGALVPSASTTFATIMGINGSRRPSEEGGKEKGNEKDGASKDKDQSTEAEREAAASPPPPIHVAISPKMGRPDPHHVGISPKMGRPDQKAGGGRSKSEHIDSQQSMSSLTANDVPQMGLESGQSSGERTGVGLESGQSSGEEDRARARESEAGGFSYPAASSAELSPLTPTNLARINEEAAAVRAAGKPVKISGRIEGANDHTGGEGAPRARRGSVDSLDGYSSRIISDGESDVLGMKLLDALGPVARERFTSQQLSMVADMYRMLRDGLTVRKHSKGHAPQHRELFCDAGLNVLYWRVPKQGLLTEQAELEMVKTAWEESKGGRHKSSSWFRSSDKDRVLVLRHATDVHADVVRSKILCRGVEKGYITRGGRRRLTGEVQYVSTDGTKVGLVSVSDSTRDLVFELEQEKWQQLFHALMVLVNYFKSTRPPLGGDEPGVAIEL